MRSPQKAKIYFLRRIPTDPFGDGWMMKVKLSAPEELDVLMTAEEYEEYVEKEAGA